MRSQKFNCNLKQSNILRIPMSSKKLFQGMHVSSSMKENLKVNTLWL